MKRSWAAVVSIAVSLSGTVVCGLAAASIAAQPASRPKVVVIKGSETPEAIPDHWVWRDAFHYLEMLKRRELTPPLERLQLSPRELAIVLAEAVAQPARDAACGQRIERHREALAAQGAREEALAQAFLDDTIECRTIDLAARDRVLGALSPDGRAALESWVNDHRRTLVVTVPAAEIEDFKRPR